MRRIHIGFVLHEYQPPTQDPGVLKRIYEEAYDPILTLAEKNKHIFFSLDIAQSLLERALPESGQPPLLPRKFPERIRNLYRNQRIELINTAAYHFLLPLVPEKIAKRQISMNLDFYKKHLTGNDFIPGMFLPELAYAPSIAKIVAESGHRWVIADDFPLVHRHRDARPAYHVPNDGVIENDGCAILLRSRFWSEKISRMDFRSGADFARTLLHKQARWRFQQKSWEDSYVILAVDIETFGHHHKGSVENFLLPFFDELRVRGEEGFISSLDYIDGHFAKRLATRVPPGSWSSLPRELDMGIPFHLWNHPQNRFHVLWNEFAKTVFSSVTIDQADPKLVKLLDTAFYSCTPWQYSHNNFKIARWCLPLFNRIAEILPGTGAQKRLTNILNEPAHQRTVGAKNYNHQKPLKFRGFYKLSF